MNQERTEKKMVTPRTTFVSGLDRNTSSQEDDGIAPPT